jgi:hypothetical protein
MWYSLTVIFSIIYRVEVIEMPLNWGYIWVGLVGLGLIVSLSAGLKDHNWLMQNSSMFLGWILLLFQTSYVNIEKIYWFIQRIKYYIQNPDTVWDLSIKYQTEGLTEENIKKVQNELLKTALLDRPELRRISNQRIEIRADELYIELFVDYEDQMFQIFFRKLPVSFRGAQRVINTRIIPIIEAIENNIIVSTKYYWLSVFFGSINPFFGLYMRRIKQTDITELNIRVKSTENEELVISKEKITIFATSLSQLADEGKKYLTLSKLPA